MGDGSMRITFTHVLISAMLTASCCHHRVPDPATVLERARVAGLRAKWRAQERARQAFLECSAGLGAKCEAEIAAYREAVK